MVLHKVICALLLQENVWKLSELTTFKPRKTAVAYNLLIRSRFQGFWTRHCKLSWRDTWNYAYSPFKSFLLVDFQYIIGIKLKSVNLKVLNYKYRVKSLRLSAILNKNVALRSLNFGESFSINYIKRTFIILEANTTENSN